MERMGSAARDQSEKRAQKRGGSDDCATSWTWIMCEREGVCLAAAKYERVDAKTAEEGGEATSLPIQRYPVKRPSSAKYTRSGWRNDRDQ